MTQFRKITSAEITHYSDNDDTMVYIGWTDAKGKLGVTVGHPESSHIQALLARARRENIKVTQTAS